MAAAGGSVFPGYGSFGFYGHTQGRIHAMRDAEVAQEEIDRTTMNKNAVCEIYTTLGGGAFIIKPVNEKGIALFRSDKSVDLMRRLNKKGKVDTVNKNLKYTTEIEATLIYFGQRKRFIDETDDGSAEPAKQVMERPSRQLDLVNHHYVAPAISCFDLYKYVVFESHPSIGLLVDEYNEGLASRELDEYQERASAFIESVNSWLSVVRRGMDSSVFPGKKQAGPDVREPRPKRVIAEIRKIKEQCVRLGERCKPDKSSLEKVSEEDEATGEHLKILNVDCTPRPPSSPTEDGALHSPTSDTPTTPFSPMTEFSQVEPASWGDFVDSSRSQGGGSRRRRRRGPSRKYKKSKRVLRRKSRSTRRR